MRTKLSKDDYAAKIHDDITWVMEQGFSGEQTHTVDVLYASTECYYGDENKDKMLRVAESEFNDKHHLNLQQYEWLVKAIEEEYNDE